MDEGLYESLVTRQLRRTIDEARAHEIDSHIEAIDVGDQSHVLARHVAEAIHRSGYVCWNPNWLG